MFLTKCRILSEYKNTYNDILNAHELHRTVQKLFTSSRKDENVLFARDFQKLDHLYIYIYSDKHPSDNPEHLHIEYVTEQRTEYTEGTHLHFRLECNPTKQSAHKRTYLTRSDDRAAWLKRQAGRFGFELLDFYECAYGDIDMEKPKKTGKKEKFSFRSVVFSGVLKVTDPILFEQAIKGGIGPEKAYGMGMLLVFS